MVQNTDPLWRVEGSGFETGFRPEGVLQEKRSPQISTQLTEHSFFLFDIQGLEVSVNELFSHFAYQIL